MNEEQSKELMEILKPLLKVYNEVRISIEKGKLVVFGVTYEGMYDLTFEGEDDD